MPKSKSSSDSPLSEGKLFGSLSPESRRKSYMPLKRKTSYKNEGDMEEELNNLLEEMDNKSIDLPKAPSGFLFPDVPKAKLKSKSPSLVIKSVPTTPLKKKALEQKLTGIEQIALNRLKLVQKAKDQTKQNKTIRDKLKSMLNRMGKSTSSTFKKGGAKSSTFKKGGAKSSTFKKGGAKSSTFKKGGAKSRKSTFKKSGAKSRTRTRKSR